MKKSILSLLFLISAFASFGQSGSQALSGVFLRVNDTTTYQAAAATRHSQGYHDIYFNNQATTPHFDIWNGSSYDHVFDFTGGGGGSGTVESVTGDGVDNTDPDNPILTFPVASEVVNTPSGGIAATDVQAALNELDTEKANLASPAFSGTPSLPTGTTGVTQTNGDNSTKLATTAYADAKVAASITNGVTTSAPNQDQVFDALALKEDAANKTTGFGTVNNTLFPTVQAVVTYVTSVTGGGYTDVAYVNTYSGVDPTGVADSKTGLQAAMASGKKVIVFDGTYRTTDVLTLNTSQIVLLRGGTTITLAGNVNTGASLFLMANQSHILSEPGARLTHAPTGTASYSGIYVDTKYQWSIQGKMQIDGFGNQGIRVVGTPSSPNQFRNGIIKDVICRANINNGFGGTLGAGHGIRLTTAEYVFILDVDCFNNQGYGILFDRAANSPINNARIISNTLGGLHILGDYAANTDHFHVSNCQINHNDAVGTYNVYVKDVDTGVNFNGCSIYGGIPFKVENSRGVSFTGCGLTSGVGSGTISIIPGTQGDGVVRMIGGHTLYSTEAMRLNTSGGGTLIMTDVMETVITPSYTSNFSAGVDSFTDSGTTSTGNNDAVSDGTTSFSDCLRIAGDGASSLHYVSRATTLTASTRYKIYVTAYMPSGNTAVDGLEIGDSGTASVNPPYQAKGKWQTYEAEFVATGTSLRIKMKSGSSDTFTAPSTDYIYIGRILIKAL